MAPPKRHHWGRIDNANKTNAAESRRKSTHNSLFTITYYFPKIPNANFSEEWKSKIPNAFAFGIFGFVGRNCNLINHAGGVYIINSEGIAYHQHEVLYIIKPQVRCTLARDEIQPQRGWWYTPHFVRQWYTKPAAWIKKERSNRFVLFLVHLQGLEPGTHWLRVSCSTNWAKGAYEVFWKRMSASPYFPGPSPAKYFQHLRA